jgi:hypothetical protein
MTFFSVLHDLNPRLKESNFPSWNGDCWRAAVALRISPVLEIVVVDIDHGVGVIRKRPNTHPLPERWSNRVIEGFQLIDWTVTSEFMQGISYEDLDANREILLRLVSMNEFRNWLEEAR